MRGHVRKGGGRWALVVELGPRPVQRCDGCACSQLRIAGTSGRRALSGDRPEHPQGQA